MTRKRKEKRVIAGDEEIGLIQKKCSENLEAQVNAPIHQAMEHLKKFAFSNALLPDYPSITISVDAFFTLIEPSAEEASVSSRWKGFEAGGRFAAKYLDFLKFEIGVPQSLNHLLTGWAFFDTGANWGTFQISYDEDEKLVIVTVDNSFLTRIDRENSHQHCQFMTGYIEGVLRKSMAYYPRWYKDVVKHDMPKLTPRSVEEKPEGEVCRFLVPLKTEELSDQFDHLYEIEGLVESGEFRRVPLEIRTVLETSLKEKLGIPLTERIYVPQLIAPFRNLKDSDTRLKDAVKRTSKIYGWASRDAHLRMVYSEAEIQDALRFVSKFLVELELWSVDEKERDLFRRQALNARSGKRKNEVVGLFLSYSHSDEVFVDKLAQDIRESGINVWVDKLEIAVGDSLVEKIQEGIEKMDYLGVVLSQNSVESEWVKREVEMAINHEIKGKKVKVLPLLYKECQIPGFLEGKLHADFTDINRYDIALEKLLNKLRK